MKYTPGKVNYVFPGNIEHITYWYDETSEKSEKCVCFFFYCFLPNCHSRNLTDLLCIIKTEARFEIEPLNINYPKSLLAVFLIECFPHVFQLGNPPHQKNGKWVRSKWFGISWLFSEGRVFLRKQSVHLNFLHNLSLVDFLGFKKKNPWGFRWKYHTAGSVVVFLILLYLV